MPSAMPLPQLLGSSLKAHPNSMRKSRVPISRSPRLEAPTRTDRPIAHPSAIRNMCGRACNIDGRLPAAILCRHDAFGELRVSPALLQVTLCSAGLLGSIRRRKSHPDRSVSDLPGITWDSLFWQRSDSMRTSLSGSPRNAQSLLHRSSLACRRTESWAIPLQFGMNRCASGCRYRGASRTVVCVGSQAVLASIPPAGSRPSARVPPRGLHWPRPPLQPDACPTPKPGPSFPLPSLSPTARRARSSSHRSRCSPSRGRLWLR